MYTSWAGALAQIRGVPLSKCTDPDHPHLGLEMHRVASVAATISAVSLSRSMSTRPILRAVVFDMDGTLTKPNLDFAEMSRRRPDFVMAQKSNSIGIQKKR